MAIDPDTGEEVAEGGDNQAARIAELEAKAQKADELEQQLKEKEDELAKERAKDKNFGEFRKKEEVTRSKLGKEVDELKTQIETERKGREELYGVILNNAKESALSQLAGNDKDLRVKLEERVKESEAYFGKPKSDAEVIARYEKAFEFEKGARRKVNPLYAFSPVTGVAPEEPKEKRFTETPEGDALFRAKFPKIAELEDKLKKGK